MKLTVSKEIAIIDIGTYCMVGKVIKQTSTLPTVYARQPAEVELELCTVSMIFIESQAVKRKTRD